MSIELAAQVAELEKKMVGWRRDIHQFAESGWLEFRTATIVAEELETLGYQLQLGKEVFVADARMGVPDADTLACHEQRALEQGAIARWLPHFSGGFTGIVATLDSGRPGPTLGFRVDMDALDLDEAREEGHRPCREGFVSINENMTHACGHDAHTAIGLGLAHLLKQTQDQWSGRVKLIFQPSEEGTRGAKAMMEAGVVDDVDYFTAIHIGTGLPLGAVVCGHDTFMATTKLDVTFTGKASHAGGKPEEGSNALLAAAQAALGLHSISRHSGGASRINVGVLQAGSGRNVVPAKAQMKIETRGKTNEVNDFICQRAMEVLAGAAAMYGVQHQVKLMGAAQSSVPSPVWVDFIRQQAAATQRFDTIIDRLEAAAGSEDATYFMERVKALGGLASYVVFGTELSAGHHNEHFDFDEKVLSNALHTLGLLVLNFSEFRHGDR
ncbi:peptidase M20 [Pokkaliibacter plantistimulans]|uniref:Peptidase M20 n=1 Tax=Proteobacteria bacterium 228 TaxID=2083153 RepID=A0A2S5KTI4_9PROT|nr:amidohydrolase [Pokkaliibacter plantistimulans]PPC77955.1 peptidase M20 [Pokkaliibacter plantistimulans]